MAVKIHHHAGKRRSGEKGVLVLMSVVALLLTTLSATSAFSNTSLKGTIAFSSDRDGDREIYVMDVDGGPATQLTFNSAFDGNPEWSPDAERIIFDSDRDGDLEIYVMDAVGGPATQLTNNSELASQLFVVPKLRYPGVWHQSGVPFFTGVTR